MFGGFFDKLKNGLSKTRDGFTDKIGETLSKAKKIDDDMYEELEEILITADIGVETSLYIIDRLKEMVEERKIKDPKKLYFCLKEIIIEILGTDINTIRPNETPAVYFIVGVNGVGKTTSVGKIAAKLKNNHYKVLIAAADTFRAAAIDQLEVWSNRAGVDIVKQNEGSDPAAVVYDAIQASKARDVEVLLCDTAGRLHNKKNLMNELGKINKIIDKEFEEAYKQTLLVLDATTGQNAISQAKVFKEVANITGVALTKLDGTAKGGVVIALQSELGLPVKLVGVGEGIEDLQVFNAEDFVEAIFN